MAPATSRAELLVPDDNPLCFYWFSPSASTSFNCQVDPQLGNYARYRELQAFLWLYSSNFKEQSPIACASWRPLPQSSTTHWSCISLAATVQFLYPQWACSPIPPSPAGLPHLWHLQNLISYSCYPQKLNPSPWFLLGVEKHILRLPNVSHLVLGSSRNSVIIMIVNVMSSLEACMKGPIPSQ